MRKPQGRQQPQASDTAALRAMAWCWLPEAGPNSLPAEQGGQALSPWWGTLCKMCVLGGAPDSFDFSHTQSVGTRCNL